jgi:hypothetical protein
MIVPPDAKAEAEAEALVNCGTAILLVKRRTARTLRFRGFSEKVSQSVLLYMGCNGGNEGRVGRLTKSVFLPSPMGKMVT